MSAIRLPETALPDTPCAGCERPIGPGPILKLASNAVVHFDNYNCLIQYGKLREIPKPSAEPEEPAVIEADAKSDFLWFATHPTRKFRACAGAGGIWLIRRRPQRNDVADVFLRIFTRALELPEDNDISLAIAWYRVVRSDMPPEEARKAAAKALKKGAAP